MSCKTEAGSFFLTVSITQANILVDQTCHARLADFGLLTILSDSATSNSYTQGGTTRWMSPELFRPETNSPRRTKYSDCYALGMVIYEVLSGRIPFYQYHTSSIFWKVSQGDRPGRPEGVEGLWFTDDVWEMLGRCWAPKPENRPSIGDILQCLERVSSSWTPPSPLLLGPPPSADLVAAELPGQITTASTGASRTDFPSRVAKFQSPYRESVAESVNRARQAIFIFTSSTDLLPHQVPPNHLEQGLPPPASNSLLTQDPMRENTSSAEAEPADPGSWNNGDGLRSESNTVTAAAVDFNNLWMKARAARDELESAQTLSSILTWKDGRTFILDLEPTDAALCIEILHRVRSGSPLLSVTLAY